VKPREGLVSEVNVVRYQRRWVPPGSLVPGWAMMVDPALITKSSRELMPFTGGAHSSAREPGADDDVPF
jgi:hypothetical protein